MDHPISQPFVPTANAEGWMNAQSYELAFWKNEWPYRDWPLEKLQNLRQGDACWFLKEMGFVKKSEREFENFAGAVLEVGCGPIGFFELMEGVEVVSQDSLMRAYAENLGFSLLGTRGSTTYVDDGIKEIKQKFDFVVCSNVLDHTADWIAFLEACVSRLVSGGQLLLFTDSRGVPAAGHTQIFTFSQLKTVIRLLGAKSMPVARSLEMPAEDKHCDFKNFIRAFF